MTHMAGKRWTSICVICVVLLATLVVVQLSSARPALAVGGLERVSFASAYNTNPDKWAVAFCPPGKVVLGGGGVLGGGLDQVFLTALVPSSNARAYSAQGRAAPGFARSWSVTAYAICAPAPAGYEQVVTSSVTSETFQLGRADCSPGKRALSAGAYAVPLGSALPGLTLIRPDGYLTLGWAAARTVYPNQSSAQWRLDTKVICVDELPGQQNVGKVVNAVGANLQCPPGNQVHGLGGGSSLSDSGAYFLAYLEPSADFQWASAYMTRAPNGGQVQATCAA